MRALSAIDAASIALRVTRSSDSEASASRYCTAAAVDTYEPGKFNEWGVSGTLIAETTAARLQTGIAVGYYDEDIGFDDALLIVPFDAPDMLEAVRALLPSPA